MLAEVIAMLEELLRGAAGCVEISEPARGVRCCAVDAYLAAEAEFGAGSRLEALFCTVGEVRVGGAVCTNRQILLLSPDVTGRAEFPARRLKGVLVSARRGERGGLNSLFSLGAGTDERMEDFLTSQGGVYVCPQSVWSEAVFSALRELPAEERGQYCAVKCAELLYLLCNSGQQENGGKKRYRDPYLVDTVRHIHEYMLANLGEKLTIGDLARKFRIAPTSFKECFREIYGESVHAYLLNRRMERAAELLRTTQLPVFQIAESVGYSSASQFGVEFKRRYSLSPLSYRKNVREKNV